MTTVQNIIDTHDARKAQTILRGAIYSVAECEDIDLTAIATKANGSALVNSTHTASKKMRSVSVSQIFDRMSAKSLGYLLEELMLEEGLGSILDAFKYVPTDGSMCEMWPWSNEVDLNNVIISSHIPDDLDTSPTSPTSPTYDVTDDIATAANVLLKVATKGEMDDLQGLLDEVVALRNKPAPVAVAAIVPASGDIPEGTPRRVNAQVVFGIQDDLLDMEITVYDWEYDNPLTPAKDHNYIFNVSNLADALWAIDTKNNAWLTGHTGTGKTTFIAQVCAHTGRMMMRANMDSAIERPDFVGAMSVTTDDDGNQITKFVDGFLPKAMQLPVVMLLDEYDAIRADISYVMQPVLEGGALRLMEDGGRLVHPHPDFHIMATANTVGTGDSSGLYASAVKVQSRASINRFPVFIKVDYLSSVEEMALVKKFAPQLSSSAYNMLCDFVTHYRRAFADGTIATPISPRNTITIGKYVADFEWRLGTMVAVKRALEMNVMNTIDEGDSIAVTGIMDRITA